MNPQLQQLVDKARSGDEAAVSNLLQALRANVPSARTLLDFALSDDAPLRRIAVVLGGERTEVEVHAALAGLADDPESAVRLALAETAKRSPWQPFDGAVRKLLADHDDAVRQAAVAAAAVRPALELGLVERLGRDGAWRVRQEAARALGDASAAVLPALLTAVAEDSDSDVRGAAAAAIDKHLTKHKGWPAAVARPKFSVLRAARENVGKLRGGPCPLLAAWLEERIENDVDLDTLKTYGTVLTLEAEAGRLPHAYGIEESIDVVWKALSGEGSRAVVLVGESGCGKTALVYELTHRLRTQAGGPWHVLRVPPADFLAGTVYLGEWETKLQKLVQAIRRPRRVVLYIPNIEELAMTGVTSKSDMNVASALAPHIERGDLLVLGESTVEAFRKGLGAVRPLRRLFHTVQLPEAGLEETRSILQAVAAESGADASDAVLDRLVELSDFYAGGAVEPGRSVGLLRRVLGAPDRKGPLCDREIIETLSTSTGVPPDFLDDAVPLDRAAVRAFFEARVMGQPEAIDAVVDLVTLIKAGLNDPNKPFGVQLFVGPTGVGKTELARALAELLFGDPARLVRFDMSEYATYEAFERLIGQRGAPACSPPWCANGRSSSC